MYATACRTEKGKLVVIMCINFMQYLFKHVQVTMSSVLDKELDHEWVKIVEDVVHPKTVSSNEVRISLMIITSNV